MYKKNDRKLTLAKTTIRTLEDRNLVHAHGGITITETNPTAGRERCTSAFFGC
jgi:hypothetical protein